MIFLYVAPRYHTNQVPIMEYLVDQGHEVHFLAYRKEKTENYDVVSPQFCKPSLYFRMKVYLFFRREANSTKRERFRMSKFMPSFIWTLLYIRKVKPNVIIIRNRNFATSVMYFAGKLCGVSHILLYIQDACYAKQIRKDGAFKRFVKHIIYPSKVYSPVDRSEITSENLIQMGYHFIPFAMNFDDKIVQGRSYLRGGLINIIDVGKYRDYKNHFVLVKAVALLPEEIRNQFRISIIGQAYSEEEKRYKSELESFISDNDLSSIIRSMEAVPYSEMIDQYLSHDIFILTSKVEAASISLLEAMKYGNVCISTNRNGTASYINNDLGYIFESDNAESLKDVLLNITDNKPQIPQMGKQTYEYAKRNYSTASYFNKLMQLIDEQ